jgi:regulator of sigma E protease
MLSQPPLWFVIVAFICAIGPLVFFHELGHYWVARLFGVGAEQFSIGFGREVTGWTDKRGTRWKVGWVPLGGYVRFVGDANPASQPDSQAVTPADQQSTAFHLRPWWQRFLIVLAGPVANFLLAIAIFAAFFALFGVPRTPALVGQIQPNSVAASVGLLPGDRIEQIAGQQVETFEDLRRIVSIRPGETVAIQFERDDQQRAITATLGIQEISDEFGQKYRIGLLGVLGGDRVLEELPVSRILPEATKATFNITRAIIDVMGQIVVGDRSASEIGGPLRMAQVAGQRASLGWTDFVYLLAVFSINLGFINLLPVPMLDGGHLVFYAAEGLRGRPVSERAQDWAFRGGLALLLALLFFTTVNDLASFGLFERLGRLIG